MLLFTRSHLVGVVALLSAGTMLAADPAAVVRRVSSGVEARKTGDLKTAAAELVLAVKEAEESSDDKLQALAYLELAQLRHDEFDSAAVKLYEKGVEKAAAGYGRDSFEYAVAAHNYGQLLSDLGEYAKARPLLERAVRNLPAESATPAHRQTFLMTLGTLCRREGNLEAAVKHYAEVLTGIEKDRNSDPALAAALCLNLGVAFAQGGQLDAAERTLKKAVSLLGDGKASETPQAAACFNALSRVKLKQGDTAAAGEWAEKSVTICERRCGKAHPHTATAVESLAEAQARAAAEVVEAAQTAAAKFEAIAPAEEAVKEATELYRINKSGTQNVVGANNLFDALRPLQAIQALNTARQNYLGAIMDHNRAQLRLLAATGTPPAANAGVK